ncbi:MAG: polyprenyl synthetase family protein [Bacteroidales bacterium]|jgi:geranylgeranyl diphosphate synthase type II|nr:polyprenyl synthetase family protein [Bacteroidales bacterium]
MNTIEQLQLLAIEIIEKENFNYEPKSLFLPIEYAMHQGGKRVRPFLVLLSCDCFSKDVSLAKYSAIAIEILHNFTLLHDDIMDNSPLRRGKETVYKKYSINSAILSGDAMFALAINKVMETPKKEITPFLAQEICLASIEICKGQALDMSFEERDDVEIEEYIDMVRLKTSVLLGCALKLGAICAKASKEEQEIIYSFGEKLGIAFQIQDDILDCWSNVSTFGKIVGRDILDKKKTFLYLKALSLLKDEKKENFKQLYNSSFENNEEKIFKVKQIYEELNIRDIAFNESLSYTNEAMEMVKRLSIDESKAENLITFANILLGREK